MSLVPNSNQRASSLQYAHKLHHLWPYLHVHWVDTIAHVILDAAGKYNVHTIIHGGKGESEINPELGSVALAVVRKAKCCAGGEIAALSMGRNRDSSRSYS